MIFSFTEVFCATHQTEVGHTQENWTYQIYYHLPGGPKNGAIEVSFRVFGEDFYATLYSVPPRLIARRYINDLFVPQHGWFEEFLEIGVPYAVLDEIIAALLKQTGWQNHA